MTTTKPADTRTKLFDYAPNAAGYLKPIASELSLNDDTQIVLLAGHMGTMLPEVDPIKVADATNEYCTKINLPSKFMVRALASVVDHCELAILSGELVVNDDYERFNVYLNKAATELRSAKVDDKTKKDLETAKSLSKMAAEQHKDVILPAGTQTAPVEPVKVADKPPVETPVSPVVKYTLSPVWIAEATALLDKPYPMSDKKSNAVLMRQTFPGKKCGHDLYIDIVNAEPRPAAEVYIVSDGKVVSSAIPFYSFDTKIELSFEDDIYEIVPG